MGGEKRADYKPILIAVGVLAVIGILLSVLPAFIRVSSGNAYANEVNKVKSLLTTCVMFAADDDGNFPKSLDELYPEYIDDVKLLMFYDRKTGESKPYIYFPNIKNTDFSGTPLIATPIIKSKDYDFRIVGYVGGHVVVVREDEYREMLTK